MRGALFTLGVGALVAGIAGASLFRARSLMERELGVMTSQVDAMASGWEASKAPPSGRVVTFLMSDLRAAYDPFEISPETDGGFVQAAGDWIGRSLIGGSAAVADDTPILRAFADSTQLVRWTHVRFSAVSEKAMSRELEKAIIRAHDAGAEINVVAQGQDAAPVLLALQRLQGVERGGQKVGANKIFLLGVNAKTLKKIPTIAALDPAKLGNVIELAAVWSSRERASSVQMDFLIGRRGGTALKLESVWPAVGVDGHTIENTLKLLRSFLESPSPVDEMIALQEAALKESQAKKAELAAVKAQEAAAAAEQEQAKAQAQEQARAKTAAVLERAQAKNMPFLAAAKGAPNAAAPAPGAAAPPRRPRTGTIPGPSDWPSANVKEFNSSFTGKDIGWLVSAPKTVLDSISVENSIRMPDSTPDCKAVIELRAISLKSMQAGDRDLAIQLLYETHSNILHQPLLGNFGKTRVHGYPAYVYKTAAQAVERTYQVIEVEQHMVYLFLEVNFGKEENRAACLKTHMPLYQRIADNIRPN